MALADRIYYDMVKTVTDDGDFRADRTGVGTLSVFGRSYRYDLRAGFPILTTKRVNFRAVAQELLWFIRGDTNTNTLGNHIWDPWADENGDLGPIYGKQWRNFGGVDQLADVIENLRNNPTSRRHIVSAWNAGELADMALPPCHLLFQFYQTHDGNLDLQLYQRSADVAVGVPFNVASYALLLSMVANELGLVPRYFMHVMGDMHIYYNHLDSINEQIEMPMLAAPELLLPRDKPVFDVILDDIQLVNYTHGPRIKYAVAV